MTTSPADPRERAAGRAPRRALVAGSVGNFIEWYEFGVYGFFATIIAANFFTPHGGTEIEGLVKTYASFGIAFFFRPIGAAVFGRVGDRIGHAAHADPGAAADDRRHDAHRSAAHVRHAGRGRALAAHPVADPPRAVRGRGVRRRRVDHDGVRASEWRGLYGAWQSFTVALGLLAGAGVAALLATVMSEESLGDWGWRLPFLATLPIGLVALWLRLRLEETPFFRAAADGETGPPPGLGAPSAAPERVADPREMAAAIVMGAARIMGWAAAGYTFLVVMPSYLQATLNATFQQALVATVVANAGFALSILPAGLLSDRIGRRPVMLTGAALVAVLAFPLLDVLQE